MKNIIIADKQLTKDIMHRYHTLHCSEQCMVNSQYILLDGSSIRQWQDIDIETVGAIIVDFNSAFLVEKCHVPCVIGGTCKMYIHAEGDFFNAQDMHDTQSVVDQLIAEKRWSTVKKINELKIHLNYLFNKTQLDVYPTYMQLEMTDYCNAQCIMCSHLYQKNIGASHLKASSFDAVQSMLPYLRVAVLHGNGEPFLNPNFVQYLEQYSQYGIMVSTSTNLSIFNENIAYYINKCFADIRVSCDACTQEVFEGIRRNLSFDTMQNNLAMLSQLCSGVEKVMTVVMMRQNIHQIADMVRFAKKYDFQQIIFSNMMPSVALDNHGDSPLNYKGQVKCQLIEAQKIANALQISIVYPDMYDMVDEVSSEPIDASFVSSQKILERVQFINDTYGIYQPPVEQLSSCRWDIDRVPCRGICDWCMEKTYIDIHGNVAVCCINPKYTVGNINEQSFSQIWNGEEMQKIRQSFYDGALPDFCEGCHFVLNHSLQHIEHVEQNDAFKNRRCISKLYTDSL